MFPRWWSPPSWILPKCYIWPICHKIRDRCYFTVKFGDNRLNGSKVIAFCLFPRWCCRHLGFRGNVYLNNLSENISPMLHSHQIWWQSVERFQSYSICLISRWGLPPSWISWICYIWSSFQKVCHQCYFPVKYGDNRLNGSKVTALCQYSRWRPPPSWISWKCYIWSCFQKVLHQCYFPVNMVTICWMVQQL